MSTIATPLSTLNDVFGYSQFRENQELIINNTLSKKDSLVILPTGSGKSICFQIPALLQPGLTIVVSPLIALMEDQVARLKEMGILAACLHSQIDPDEKRETIHLITSGQLKLLYMAPESLLQERFLQFIKPIAISLFAIDEAHCISVWGNDFRPEYTKLARLKTIWPDVPVIALTATADAATQDDIVKQLHLRESTRFVSSFERPNLNIQAVPGLGRYKQIVNFLRKYKNQSGIIYCLSRKSTEAISAKLNKDGFRTAHYHAKLSGSDRKKTQLAFQNDQVDIICATIAFGMGIDKSNVRFVIHYNLPKNIEAYYQEIGRAGRDGEPAETLLFYSWADITRLKSFITDSPSNIEFKTVQLAKLDRMWELASAHSCRTNLILNYFGEFVNRKCMHCDNCNQPPEVFDGTELAQKALSGIVRAKENIGINLLVDVLRGSQKQAIISERLHLLKTFGVGADLPFLDWKAYITQMINQGLISIDYTDHSKLKRTPFSKDVLLGKHQVQLVRFMKDKPKAKAITKGELLDNELFTSLKDWRLKMSKEKGIPAYAVFNDKTLEEIVDRKPINQEDLLAIDGIGKVKMDQYGSIILDFIREYLRTQDHKKVKGKTQLQSLHLFKSGYSLAEIAKSRNLNASTILSHLASLYEKGEQMDPTELMPLNELVEVGFHWLDAGKPDESKVIYERLKGKYDYSKIKLGVMWQKFQLEGNN